MTRTNLLYVLGTAFLSLAVAGTAAAQVTETGTANAGIVQALTLVEVTELDFGNIIANAAGDTVTLNRATNAATCPASTCSGHARGEWTVDGSDLTVTINPESPITLDAGGGNTMSATIDADATVVISGGPTTFYTGGVLTVGVAQAEGTYTVGYDVTVDYQ